MLTFVVYIHLTGKTEFHHLNCVTKEWSNQKIHFDAFSIISNLQLTSNLTINFDDKNDRGILKLWNINSLSSSCGSENQQSHRGKKNIHSYRYFTHSSMKIIYVFDQYDIQQIIMILIDSSR